MTFKKLILQNYKKFTNKEIYFNSGINVILGDNEAGKSTISEALLDALYADPRTQNKSVLGRIKSWKTDENPKIELIFEHNANEFSIIKDFAKKEAKLTNIDSGKSITNLEDITDSIAEVVGLATREVYQSTAFISHDDIARIATTDKSFVNALQNIATEGPEDVSLQGILITLNDELKKMRLGMDRHANNPGPLRLSENRIKEIKAEILQKSDQVKKVAESAQLGTSADKELAEVEEKIKEIEQLLENYSINEKAQEKLKSLDAQIKQIEWTLVAYEDLQRKKTHMTSDLEMYSQYKKFDAEKASLELNRLLDLRKLASEELNRISIIDSKDDFSPTKDVFLKTLLFVGLLAIAGVSYLIFRQWLLTAVVLVLGAIIALLFSKLIGKSAHDAINSQREQNKQNVDQWKFKIQSATEGIKKILDDFRVEDPSGFFTNKARYGLLNENLRQVDSQISGLLLKASINDIKQEQINLLQAKKEIEINTLTNEVKKSKITSHEYLSFSRELDKLYNKQKDLQKQLTVSHVRVSDSEVDTDYITRLEEELETNNLNLLYWRKKEKIYQLAYDNIKQALKETAKTASAVVESEIEKDLKQLTAGRYQKVRMGDDFSLTVYSPEKESWVNPIDNLSSGTIDQIYLLARLGFLKAITKNNGVPIICDDAFVTFDLNRRGELMGIFKLLAERYQILLFTLYPEYEEWGSLYKIS